MCLTPSHLVELCNMKVNKVLPHGFVIKAMEILMQRKYQSAEDLVKEQKWIETMRDPER